MIAIVCGLSPVYVMFVICCVPASYDCVTCVTLSPVYVKLADVYKVLEVPLTDNDPTIVVFPKLELCAPTAKLTPLIETVVKTPPSLNPVLGLIIPVKSPPSP